MDYTILHTLGDQKKRIVAQNTVMHTTTLPKGVDSNCFNKTIFGLDAPIKYANYNIDCQGK